MSLLSGYKEESQRGLWEDLTYRLDFHAFTHEDRTMML